MRLAVKPGTVSILYSRNSVDVFDWEGRWIVGHEPGATIQCALDGRVLKKASSQNRDVGPWSRRRQRLDADAGRAMLDRARQRVRAHAGDVRRALAEASPSPPRGWLTAVLGFDKDGAVAQGSRFRAVYAPVGMLPPDQYRAVVLQAALGCPWNQCTFCTLYRDQPFAVRSLAEFRNHLGAVRAFFGAALAGRRWLFVGEGDALSLPTHRLASLLTAAAGAFPVAPPWLAGRDLQAWLAAHPVGFAGFSGFIDAGAGARRTVADYGALRALGLRRAHLGLETGNARLYRELRKRGDVGAACATVAALRAAGVGVAVIVLVGVGGQEYAAGHVRDTLAALDAMCLGREDMVYLSLLQVMPGGAYRRWAEGEGVTPLTVEELGGQYRALAAALRKPGGPRVAAYDIAEFVY